MLQVRDIAWVAGLLEGEGCFQLQKTYRVGVSYYNYPMITVRMTDEDVVNRLSILFRHHYLRENPTNENHKAIYIVRIQGSRAIQWMMTIYPLMGRRRKEKIREIISVWHNTGPKNGVKFRRFPRKKIKELQLSG